MRQPLGMTLDAYLKREGKGSLIKLAAAVGATPTQVSKWRYGRVTPSLKQALDIERATRKRVRASDLLVIEADPQTNKAS